MLCLCHYGPALLRFWFQTNLGHKNSASCLEIQAGKTFTYQGHSLVTFYVQFLCFARSKLDMWVHAENLCSILKLVYFDSWSWQSLCRLVMFLTVFSTGRTKWNTAAIKSLLLFIFVFWFLAEMCCFSKSEMHFGWHRFRFSPCLICKRVQKSQVILALLEGFRELHLEW